MRHLTKLSFLCLFSSLAIACGDPAAHGDDQEVITTVTLSFAPAGGGSPVVASFDDPDGDGGAAPVIDPIDLVSGTTYAMTVRFLNRLEEPPEDITIEVADEAGEHQLFFTGTAVDGPASDQPAAPLTHAYADTDGGGLPIGLSNTIVAATGTGTLTVTLRHLPPVNNTDVKTADLATQVRTGGFAAIAGETDVQVNFVTTVP